MSAGISYSALTTYGKATLPSVDSWGTNMNILKDPPRSITTRRIDKVFDDLSIVQTMADSRDRFCDHINVYARGVNPMVSVSYNNTKGRQAKLPYNVMDAGAFRPPSQRPHDLLPLTRLPRLVTSAYAQPTNIDATKKVVTTCDKKDIRKNPIRNQNVIPVYSNPLSRSTTAPREVKYAINPEPMRLETKSTKAPQDMRNVRNSIENFTSMVRSDVLKPQFHLNKESSLKSNTNTNVNTNKYLQQTVKGEVRTNRNDTRKRVSFLDQNGEVIPRTKEVLQGQYSTQKTQHGVKGIEHRDIQLEKNIPTYEALSHQSDPTRYVRHAQPEYELYQNRPTPSVATNHSTGLTRLENYESRDPTIRKTLSLNNTVTTNGYTPTMLAPDTNADRGLPNLHSERKLSFKQKVSDAFFEKNSSSYR